MALAPDIKRAIMAFDKAAQAYAFKGSAHPSDWPAIEHQYTQARRRLEQLIERRLEGRA
jgi:hypothetical protein